MTAGLDVASWRPEPLTRARRQIALVRATLDAALVELGPPPSAAWSGAAAEAAGERHRDFVERIRSLADTVALLDRALARATDRLAALALVVLSWGTPGLEGMASPGTRAVAEGIDADLAAALRRAAHEASTDASRAEPPVPHRLEPVALVSPALWSTSAASEDRKNRLLLDGAEADLVAQVAALEPGPRTWRDLLGGTAGAATIGTFGGGRRRIAYEQAVAKLAAVRATRQVLDQRDGRVRQLLTFDVSGRSARVAVAVGDVDRAQHLAVVVPGFTTTVERDLTGSDRLAADLADEATHTAALVGDRRDVAVVSWLGYDIPQTADTFRGAYSVVLRRSAEEGAEALDQFLDTLPPDRHLTLVGHSYGSTTAALAVAHRATPVDDLVVLGSPGLGVNRTADLGLPPRRVHVLEADDDPVADLGWFGPDPDAMPGVDRLSTEAAWLPDQTIGEVATGHSRYLAPGTTSQWNVAAVVVGAPLVRGDRPPASW